MYKKMRKVMITGLAAWMMISSAACGNKAEDTPAMTGESAVEETDAAAQESDAQDEDAQDTNAQDTDAENAASSWTAEGNFIDEADNHLILYHMLVENGYEKDAWSGTIVSDGDMNGGELEEADGTLVGDFVTLDDNGMVSEGIHVTLTQEKDGVFLQMADGTEYHFMPDNTDYSEAVGEMLPFFQYNDIYGTDGFDAVYAAAYDYLAFEKEKEYEPSHAMVPYVQIVDIDESNAKDVLLYGDYWLWEFEKQDDTLAAVSGGHCPGIIHAERFGEGETAIYSALSMEEALTDDDAKEMFGEYYDHYQTIASDDKTRDAKVAQVISDYVKTNHLEVSKYQMSEEEPKELP